MLIYLAGPYTGSTPKERDDNVMRAKMIGLFVILLGDDPFIPQSMTHGLEDFGVSYERFLYLGLNILQRCDALLLLPNWEISKGAKKELKAAQKLGVKVFESLEEYIKFKMEGG
jgi:hypothetical protein